jgi:hypothetical protein
LALALGTLIDDTMGKEKAQTRAGGASSSTTSNAPTVQRAPHDETAARARTSRSSSAAAEDVASWERSAVSVLNALTRASRARSKAMLAQTSAAGTSTAARGGGVGGEEEVITADEGPRAAAAGKMPAAAVEDEEDDEEMSEAEEEMEKEDDDEDEDEKDEEDDEEDEVYALIGHRWRHGKDEWLVRWAGCDSDDDTWEPDSSLPNAQFKAMKIAALCEPPKPPPQCSGLVGAEVEGDAPSPSLCSRLGPHESDYISDGQQPRMRLIRRSIGQLDTTIDWEAAAEGEGEGDDPPFTPSGGKKRAYESADDEEDEDEEVGDEAWYENPELGVAVRSTRPPSSRRRRCCRRRSRCRRG